MSEDQIDEEQLRKLLGSVTVITTDDLIALREFMGLATRRPPPPLWRRVLSAVRLAIMWPYNKIAYLLIGRRKVVKRWQELAGVDEPLPDLSLETYPRPSDIHPFSDDLN